MGGAAINSFKDHWTRLITRELAGYEDLSRDDPFDNWDRLTNPEVRIELPLGEALELSCGDANRELVDVFLDKVLALAERMLAERIYERRACKALFPLNRARIRRAFIYANWLRHRRLALASVRETVADLLAWSQEQHRIDWNESNQVSFLSAVSLSLLADSTVTEAVLSQSYTCPNRAKQTDALRRAALRRSGDDMAGLLPLDEYDACFDDVRRPTRPQLISSFEMAYVRLVAYSQPVTPIDPWGAVRLMSR